MDGSLVSPRHHRDQLEHGQVHGDDHAADDAAHENDHDRLDDGRQVVHRLVDLGLVEHRDLGQHLVQRSGLLADRDHLYHHWIHTKKPTIPAAMAHQNEVRKCDAPSTIFVGSGNSPPKSVNIFANVGMMKMSMNAVAPRATVSTTAG